MLLRHRLAITWTLIVVLAALTAPLSIKTAVQATREQKAGLVLAQRGDIRAALQHWHRTILYEPKALPTLLNISCAEWDIGYHDEALSYFQRALVAGARWDQPNTPQVCFVNLPSYHGFRLTDINRFPAAYRAPAAGDTDGVALAGIAMDASHKTYLDWERMLAAACLNYRADYKLVASDMITLALNAPDLRPLPRGPLLDCSVTMKKEYPAKKVNGANLYFFLRLGDRMLLKDSPIPATSTEGNQR